MLELIAGLSSRVKGRYTSMTNPFPRRRHMSGASGWSFRDGAFPAHDRPRKHRVPTEDAAIRLEYHRRARRGNVGLGRTSRVSGSKAERALWGQRQRIAIARALAFEPELLLDEPLSSLDKKLRDTMREELLRIHEETDVTTIHVTHNQEEALTMADRIAVVNEGISNSSRPHRNCIPNHRHHLLRISSATRTCSTELSLASTET
ncbi:hypothetical protein D8S78_23745 [Natrialba swarupiae]|nr:hypothetical protein [Natrialba swarupiae]